MKIVTKFLILATILVLSTCASIKNMNNRFKSQAKAKDEGSGSWREGYLCPRIKLNYNNNLNIEAREVRFEATQLESSIGKTNVIGWEFSTSKNVGENLKRFVTQNGGKWIIPFRFISGKFVYTNPWGDNKTISGWLKNDDGETAQITIDLPYKLFGYYINDEEGEKIAGLLTRLGTEHQTIVRTNKSGANSAASEYKAAKPLENAANGDASKLAAEIANQEKKLTDLQNSYQAKKTNLENAQKEVVTLRNQLAEKEKAIEAENFNLNNVSREMNSISTNIANLKKGNNDVQETKAKYGKIASDALTKLNGFMNNLRVEAPTRSNEITNAENAVKNLNTSDFVNNLNKIHPTQ